MNLIKSIISSSIDVKSHILNDDDFISKIKTVSDIIENAFRNKNKVLFCGNGGSAADAQHLAAEFSGRFYFDRDPLYSEALHVNTSYITAVANDYDYDLIYSRLIKAKGKKGDILIGLSTSGNSKNIINAFEQATKQEMTTIAFTGETGGNLKPVSDHLLNVPSQDTPRIQESHILIGHIVCQLVEAALFKA
jgi:D-sedoheptulose 7-phosphate isomerase